MSSGNSVRRRMAYVLAMIAALGALAPLFCQAPPRKGMPRAQKHESRQEIFQLEDKWRDALLKGDTAAMEKLLADDYMAILPNGTLQTKEETLASLRSGTTHLTSIIISDRRVRFYGTTALVTSRASVKGSLPSGPISGSYRYTRVYVKDKQGAWKVVSFEASRIRGERKKK